MRSVVVVLPASMWAMMPIFLHRSSGTVLDTAFFFSSLRTSCSPAMFAGVLIKFSSWLLALGSQLEPFAPVKNQEPTAALLPPIVRKGLVRLRHAVYIFFLLDGRAFTVRGVEQLVAQLINHSLFGAPAGVSHQPANRQRRPPVRIHFHWHLIVRAAYAPRLHFQQRLGILD